MRFVRLLLLLSSALVAHAQVYDLAFLNTVTLGTSAPMRGSAVNQFHQLTVIVSDITAGSCAAGWSGQIYLEASQDNVSWIQFTLSITSVIDNRLNWTSASGSFQYIRVNYNSGSTSTCRLSAWYSGSLTGFPSSSASGVLQVQIVGNPTLSSGQQAVTGTAVALATQISRQACIHALSTNTISVYVGPGGVTTSTGLELAPDEAVCLPVANLNEFYVVASTTGATVTWASTY